MITYYVLAAISYYFAPKIIPTSKDKFKETHLYYSYYPAAVHAMISTIFVIIKISTEGLNDGTISSNFSRLIIAQSLGYFMHDTVKCELLSLNETPMRIHHVLSILGCSSGLVGNYGSSELCNALLIAEVSNIFLTSRAIIRYLNLKGNMLYFINELGFALTFILNRLVIGPIYAMNLFKIANTPLLCKTLGCLTNFISVIWIAEILSSIGMKYTMNTKSKLGLMYRKFANGLKKSPFIFIGFSSAIIMPQVILATYNHLNRI